MAITHGNKITNSAYSIQTHHFSFRGAYYGNQFQVFVYFAQLCILFAKKTPNIIHLIIQNIHNNTLRVTENIT